MKKPNDLIFYGNGLYEIERETETQYCLHERFNLQESRLVAGWVDKDAPGIGDRFPGDDFYKVQLAMVEIADQQTLFDPIP